MSPACRALLLTLVACAPAAQITPTGDTDPDPPGTDTDPPGDSGAAPVDQITWYADVQPILQQHCTRCHESGGLGTGDFTDYETSAAMAEIMLSQIDAGHMPPPASDPECRDYAGSDTLVMAEGARDTLAAWIEDGRPEGDPADAVEVHPVDDRLTDPDFSVQVAQPHAPSFDVEGNEWRCFVVDGVPEEDYFITGMQATLDAKSMVHHIVLHSVDPALITDAWRDPGGFDCYDGSQYSIALDQIGVWAPGMLPVELPEGVGLQMQGGVPLILEFHYFDPGTLEPGAADQSGYEFRTADTVETPAYPYVWGPTDLAIPAGEAAHTRSTAADFGTAYDYTLYTMWPHMHVLGDGFDVRVTNRDTSEDCLVTSDGYSFDNQYVYAFDEPYVARGGSTVEYTCVWNNTESNPDQIHETPQDVYYGPGSEDEMCFFYGFYSYGPAQPHVLVDEVLRGSVDVLDGVDDLVLTGADVVAVDYGGAGAEIGGVWFGGDLGTAYSYAGPNVPDLDGDAATWSGLEALLYTLVYNDPGQPVTVSHPVTPGESYTLQLLFFETFYTEQGFRWMDIMVEGETVVRGMDAHTNALTGGVVYTLDLVPTDDRLDVVISSAAHGDGYALLSGMVLTQTP